MRNTGLTAGKGIINDPESLMAGKLPKKRNKKCYSNDKIVC